MISGVSLNVKYKYANFAKKLSIIYLSFGS